MRTTLNTKIIFQFIVSWLAPFVAIIFFAKSALNELVNVQTKLKAAKEKIAKMEKRPSSIDTIIILKKEIDTITIIKVEPRDTCVRHYPQNPHKKTDFKNKILTFKGQSTSAEVEYNNYNKCLRKITIKDIELNNSVYLSKSKEYWGTMTAKYYDTISCNYLNGLSSGGWGLKRYKPYNVEKRKDSVFIKYEVVPRGSELSEFDTNTTLIILSARIDENYLDGKIEWSLKDSGLKNLKIISRFFLPYRIDEIDKL